MNKQRVAILICAVLGMLATFMPWVKVFTGSIDGTRDDGWITFGIFAVPLLLSLIGEHRRGISQGALYLTAAAGLVCAGIGVYKIIDFNNGLRGVSNDNPFGQLINNIVTIGFGLYLVVMAGISMAISGFALRHKQKAPSRVVYMEMAE